MALSETMAALEAAGTAQTRKTYGRHGIRPPVFGVSCADLAKLQKRIKLDQPLAEQLWATGNHDARILASKIADPKGIKASTLETWSRDLGDYVTADALAHLAALTPHAEQKVAAWTESEKEWIATTGWVLLALLAREDAEAPAAKYAAWIPRLEEGLHAAPNRVRYARNGALIAIGARGEPLAREAIAAARRIGKVEVDHGDTGCKTPDAEAYILKILSRR